MNTVPVSEFTKDQESMLNFLRHTSEDHPLDLRTAYDLGNSGNRTALYREYLELYVMGYVKGVVTRNKKERFWITQEGLKALNQIRSKA